MRRREKGRERKGELAFMPILGRTIYRNIVTVSTLYLKLNEWSNIVQFMLLVSSVAGALHFQCQFDVEILTVYV